MFQGTCIYFRHDFFDVVTGVVAEYIFRRLI